MTALKVLLRQLGIALVAIFGWSFFTAQPFIKIGADWLGLGIIARSGEHLLALINDGLDMARIESGRTGVEPWDFPLREMVDGQVDMMRERAETKGLRLRVELAPDLHPYVDRFQYTPLLQLPQRATP